MEIYVESVPENTEIFNHRLWPNQSVLATAKAHKSSHIPKQQTTTNSGSSDLSLLSIHTTNSDIADDIKIKKHKTKTSTFQDDLVIGILCQAFSCFKNMPIAYKDFRGTKIIQQNYK